MRPVEFYNTPKGDVVVKTDGLPEKNLKETDYDFIEKFLSVIEEFYPDAFAKLIKEYSKSELNRSYRNFLMARRFIKCNFGNYDNMIDLDESWNFKFEFVSCPLRGECVGEKVICSPVFDSKLSDRQLDVMRMCYDGKADEDIAEALFITIDTVKNHRKNSFRKLGIHSMPEFLRYANKNNLFQNQ